MAHLLHLPYDYLDYIYELLEEKILDYYLLYTFEFLEMMDNIFLTQNISIQFLPRSYFVSLPTCSTSKLNIKG